MSDKAYEETSENQRSERLEQRFDLEILRVDGIVENIPNGTPGEAIVCYTWFCDAKKLNWLTINQQDIIVSSIDFIFLDIHWATQPGVKAITDPNPLSGQPHPQGFAFDAPPYSTLWLINNTLLTSDPGTVKGTATSNTGPGPVRVVVNDDYYDDNIGAIKVAIQASRPALPKARLKK